MRPIDGDIAKELAKKLDTYAWTDFCSLIDSIPTLKNTPTDLPTDLPTQQPKPKLTNADRIRQMTDEELFVFLNEITDCCFSNNDCDNCPMKYSDELYYRCNIEAWLKQEAKDK